MFDDNIGIEINQILSWVTHVLIWKVLILPRYMCLEHVVLREYVYTYIDIYVNM